MAVLIDDKFLARAGLTETEAKIEIACRLFESRVIDKRTAQEFCGLDPVAFWQACGKRKIDYFGYSQSELDEDLKALDRVLESP